MKMYELYEALLGVRGGFEIFSKNVRSGRLFLLHFASYPSYFRICEAKERPFASLRASFMKIMKMYEGGVYNGFFAIRPSFPTQDMKLENGSASCSFINLGIGRVDGRGDPAPTVADVHAAGLRGEILMWTFEGVNYWWLDGRLWSRRNRDDVERGLSVPLSVEERTRVWWTFALMDAAAALLWLILFFVIGLAFFGGM